MPPAPPWKERLLALAALAAACLGAFLRLHAARLTALTADEWEMCGYVVRPFHLYFDSGEWRDNPPLWPLLLKGITVFWPRLTGHDAGFLPLRTPALLASLAAPAAAALAAARLYRREAAWWTLLWLSLNIPAVETAAHYRVYAVLSLLSPLLCLLYKKSERTFALLFPLCFLAHYSFFLWIPAWLGAVRRSRSPLGAAVWPSAALAAAACTAMLLGFQEKLSAASGLAAAIPSASLAQRIANGFGHTAQMAAFGTSPVLLLAAFLFWRRLRSEAMLLLLPLPLFALLAGQVHSFRGESLTFLYPALGVCLIGTALEAGRRLIPAAAVALSLATLSGWSILTPTTLQDLEAQGRFAPGAASVVAFQEPHELAVFQLFSYPQFSLREAFSPWRLGAQAGMLERQGEVGLAAAKPLTADFLEGLRREAQGWTPSQPPCLIEVLANPPDTPVRLLGFGQVEANLYLRRVWLWGEGDQEGRMWGFDRGVWENVLL